MAGPFDNLCADFENWARYVAGDADPTVTVERTNPTTGEATSTAEGIVALKLSSTGMPLAVGAGGQVGVTNCQFWLNGHLLEFVPEERDRVTESDGATVWNIESCERIGFGATGTVYRCPVSLARADSV